MKNQITTVRPMIDVMAFAEADSTEPPSRIKLIPVGRYKTRAYGEVNITKADVEEMAKHFNDGVRAGGAKAGLPIDVEHGTTIHKDAAAGWIKSISAEEDGGWGDVDWTSLGKQLLTDKQYKFYSPEYHPVYIDPEQSDVRLRNVMTGGGLVNKPMFKKDLPPLAMSEAGGEANKSSLLTDKNKTVTLFLELEKTPTVTGSENKMDLKTIIAKEAAQRTTEEVAFLADHKEELTFAEAKKEGFGEDKPAVKKTDPAPTVVKAGEGEVVVKASEIAELRTMAAQGVAANKTLERANLEKEIRELTFSDNGQKIPTDQVGKYADLMLKMSEEDKTAMKEMLKALPEKEIFKEKGSTTEVTGSAAGNELDKKTRELMATNKGMTYAEALSKTAGENPQLFSEHNSNLPVAGVER